MESASPVTDGMRYGTPRQNERKHRRPNGIRGAGEPPIRGNAVAGIEPPEVERLRDGDRFTAGDGGAWANAAAELATTVMIAHNTARLMVARR